MPDAGYSVQTWSGTDWLRVDFSSGSQVSSLIASWYEHAPTILSATGSPTTTNPTPDQPPVAVTAWSLFKTKDGCATEAKIECAVGTPCAPPPAQTYACLGGVKLPTTIVSNGDSCSLDCPAAPCRAVPCPGL